MKIHIFPFSRRRGTRAATMPDQVPAAVLKARCQELAKLEANLAEQYQQTLLNSDLEVLIEGHSESQPGLVFGTDRRYATVEMPGNRHDFGHLVSGRGSTIWNGKLHASRFSEPNLTSVFAPECLESAAV
jgi:threonylcarbamoyladenosine tRNA methylthiotransferase MtaB